MDSIVDIFSSIKNYVLNLLFPLSCLGCATKGEIVCDKCLAQIRHAERETERNIIAVYDYRDPLIKKVIWNLKYYHHPYIGERLGKLLFEELMEEISGLEIYTKGKPILLIPVPITSSRTKMRGYNQAFKIAQGLYHSGNKTLFELKDKIVSKKTNTLPQARIANRARRLKNVQGIFEVKNHEIVKNRTIIVIDDVTTTGGTIQEMMKVLKHAGAKKVIGFAVAH